MTNTAAHNPVSENIRVISGRVNPRWWEQRCSRNAFHGLQTSAIWNWVFSVNGQEVSCIALSRARALRVIEFESDYDAEIVFVRSELLEYRDDD